ncbi:MAG: SDR family oxidoreductase [Ktedonobacterales bacterium]|nr:SDR family oxidoreductase [Ktedonobacterales bacterium]
MSQQSIFRDGLFADKTILVSGGGTGIGRATARELAALGANVILCSRAPEHLEPTRAEIEAAGGHAMALPCNIRDPEAVEALFAAISERYGAVDGLVNNAGGQFLSPAEAITPKGWHAVVETNLTGTFYMCKAALAHGMRQRGGAIVNIVMEMWRGFPGMAHSGAARAGVVNLTQSLAVEWARYGVRVNAVAPGLIASSGLKQYPPVIQAQFTSIAADVPAQRMGTEGEIAAAVLYLLSPAAAFVSGTTLKVDGAGSLYRLQGYVVPEHAPWPAWSGDEDDGTDVSRSSRHDVGHVQADHREGANPEGVNRPQEQ